MEDLSTRCIRLDAEHAPSVSYLSMIERGKRVPAVEMLEVIAQVFQKDLDWFLDGEDSEPDITPQKGSRGGIHGMALEPGFLFSNDILSCCHKPALAVNNLLSCSFARTKSITKTTFPNLKERLKKSDVSKCHCPPRIYCRWRPRLV
jgi:transcriptional regulator with XRE-family HTH domain